MNAWIIATGGLCCIVTCGFGRWGFGYEKKLAIVSSFVFLFF
jgi:hypothetical protein